MVTVVLGGMYILICVLSLWFLTWVRWMECSRGGGGGSSYLLCLHQHWAPPISTGLLCHILRLVCLSQLFSPHPATLLVLVWQLSRKNPSPPPACPSIPKSNLTNQAKVYCISGWSLRVSVFSACGHFYFSSPRIVIYLHLNSSFSVLTFGVFVLGALRDTPHSLCILYICKLTKGEIALIPQHYVTELNTEITLQRELTSDVLNNKEPFILKSGYLHLYLIHSKGTHTA